MAINNARPNMVVGRRGVTPPERRLSREPAKERIIDLVHKGHSVKAALEKVGYAQKTYEEWRRKDESFRTRMDQARQLARRDPDVVRGERLGFAEWRLKYLKTDTPWHMMQWIDLLEGREPRDMHPSQTFVKGKRGRIVVNTPPFHAKTTCISVDYVTYRLCMDPGFRVLIISAGQELAKDILFGVKDRLTSPDFLELQKAYAPDGGWEATAESWTDSKIVFGTEVRAGSQKAGHEKDPNVIALGMRSKVYGKRADLAIVDDGVDTTNVSEHQKQLKWLRSMVESRLEAGGKLLVVGTRVAPNDLYSELLKPENYANGKSPWTYFASPAILEEAPDPKDHVTLWPYATRPWVAAGDEDMDECLCENTAECSAGYMLGDQQVFPRWDGVHLDKGPRAASSETDWSLVYQQKSVPENATFPEHAVTNSVNKHRLAGRLEADRMGHPLGGMHGKWIIAGLDPSIKGFAGIVILAVSKETGKRHLLNAYNIKAPTAKELKDRMKGLTEFYGVDEWRVEKTGLLQFFTQDAELRMWMQTRGVRFTEHLTGANKWDASYGVSSLSSLFGEYDKAWDEKGVGNVGWRTITEPLIELPRLYNNDGLKALVHQLVTWTPELDPAKTPCDLVMALWFAEVGAREHLGVGRSTTPIQWGSKNRFVSPRNSKDRLTVSLADYRSAGL